MADMEEKREFFVNAGKIDDEDELMDELDELEAALEEEKFNEIEIGSGAVEYGKVDAQSSQIHSKQPVA